LYKNKKFIGIIIRKVACMTMMQGWLIIFMRPYVHTILVY
jgi:hypothetical protein